MGLFKRKALKTIDLNSRMMNLYPNFFKYYQLNKGMINGELSACNDSLLEYRFPIITFGTVMGYVYNGIERDSANVTLYAYAISKKGDKTKKHEKFIGPDLDVETYSRVNQELMMFLVQEPKFKLISTGL
jgi:hypothetical protein